MANSSVCSFRINKRIILKTRNKISMFSRSWFWYKREEVRVSKDRSTDEKTILWNSTVVCTLETKTRKKNKFRSSTVMVLKMFFFESKMFFIGKTVPFSWFFLEKITFSIHDLNANEKKNTFRLDFSILWRKSSWPTSNDCILLCRKPFSKHFSLVKVI
jgi:hypothetical protein